MGFGGGEKTKKRCGGEAGRRDDGGELVQAVRMMAAAWLEVCRWSWWWWYGATTIKVCNYTAFEAVRGGGMDYFCTDATLHRRRRWIGSRGRVQLVRLEGGGRDADGSQAEGMAAAAGRRYPPIDSEGWDDMSVWLAEIFF